MDELLEMLEKEAKQARADLVRANINTNAGSPDYEYYFGIVRYLDGKIDGLTCAIDMIRQKRG